MRPSVPTRSSRAVVGQRYALVRPLGRGAAATTYLAEDLLRAESTHIAQGTEGPHPPPADADLVRGGTNGASRPDDEDGPGSADATASGETVALKLLTEATPAWLDVLRREFTVLTRMSHPNLTEVLDFGRDRTADGSLRGFYTARFIDGVVMSEVTTVTPSRLGRWARELASALAQLHAIGFVHGDVKPDNVLIDRGGRAVLIDLGCSRPIGDRRSLSGTLQYMANELRAGAPASERSDLFALGVTLAEIATVHGVDLPERTQLVLQRLAAADPDARPLDAAETLSRLDAPAAEVFAVSRSALAANARRAMVGRDQEIAACEQALDGLIAGQRGIRVLLFEGGRGLGKSQLLRELRWRAQVRLPVVEGHSSGARAITSLLARSIGQVAHGFHSLAAPGSSARKTPTGVVDHVSGTLDALATLRQAATPMVLLLDDAHLLNPHQEQLWLALLRSVRPEDPILLIAATDGSDRGWESPRGEAIASASLGPLDEAALRTWTDGLWPRGSMRDLLQRTRGVPGRIALALASADPESGLSTPPSTVTSADVLPSLKDDELRALAVVALAEPFATVARDVRLDAAKVAENTRRGLVSRDLLHREGLGYRLAPNLPGESLPSLLGVETCAELHRTLLGWLWPDERSALPAPAVRSEVAFHLVAVGEVERAARLLLDEDDHGRRRLAAALADNTDVRGKRAALTSLAIALPELDVVLALAAIEEDAGRPRSALALIARHLRGHGELRTDSRLRRQTTSCYLKLGNARAALREIGKAQAEPSGQKTPGRRSPGRRSQAQDDRRHEMAAAADPPWLAEERARLLELRARVELKRGDYAAVRVAAEEALAATHDPALRIEAQLDLGLAESYLGHPSRAQEMLDASLATLDYGGRRPAGRTLEESAAWPESRDPDGERDPPGQTGVHQRLRALTYAAMNAYRSGDLPRAADGYRQALALAEEQGLAAQVANAALNLGTVSHRLGDLGNALAAYDRGMRMAIALGAVSARVTLRFNLASLYLDLGLWDRAQHAGEEAAREAQEAGSTLLTGASLALLGEVALMAGELARAEDLLKRAEALFRGDGAMREVVETRIRLAEVAVHRNAPREAQDLLDNAEAICRELEAPDLVAFGERISAWVAAADGDFDAAATILDRALTRVTSVGDRLPELRLRLELEQLLRFLERIDEADLQRRQSTALVEEIAGTLEEPFRSAFVGDPRRRAIPLALGPVSGEPSRVGDEFAGWADRADTGVRIAGDTREDRVDTWPQSDPHPAGEPPRLNRSSASGHAQLDPAAVLREERWRRLLAINRQLSATLTTDAVLTNAMDAAIELTFAERGFLLLADPNTGALAVRIARNLDGDGPGGVHATFSQGMAIKVVETGEPIVTVDAEQDDRFHDNRSVHTMHLKSVICVPLGVGPWTRTGGPTGAAPVRGALYLDNRFERGRFTEDDLDLLRAFADQVAIALMNAQLHDDLQERTAQLSQRTRELTDERAKVQELLDERETHIGKLEKELSDHRAMLAHRYEYSQIVGDSSAMREVFDLLDRVIGTELTALIEGESGTGKELIAKAIHVNSPRSRGPFISINCGALPEALLEAELFGHKKGAFTGAQQARPGLFVTAAGGTLFLDEVGEMPPSMQVKLLRALEERRVRPLGAEGSVAVDFRLVAATNRRLAEEVTAGRFREDLYYRLSVVEIRVPPLRDRASDLPLLARHLLRTAAEKLGRSAPALSPAAIRVLARRRWPGNVRQLDNVITKALLLADGNSLEAEHVQAALGAPSEDRPQSRKEHQERQVADMMAALQENDWNVRRTAEQLGVCRATLYNRMRRHGIARDGQRGSG